MSSIPSSVGYSVPSIPLLLTLASFIYLLNVGEYLFSRSSVINAGLIGSLIVGVIYGSEASNILPDYVQSTFTILGYIGLILIVFEAGISTNTALLYSNLILSFIVALSGVGLPILSSILLLAYGYGYSILQSFASGVALCSTSLGTTLALLRPELRQTKTGTILLSAALLDDITGLVFAGIIPNLPHVHDGSQSSSIKWYTIARPILTSFAFGIGTPLGAILMKKLILALPDPMRHKLYIGEIQLCAIVVTLSGYVAAAQYAGTSELFGAYLAGALLQHIFGKTPNYASRGQPATSTHVKLHTPSSAFKAYIHPLLEHFLSPIFFASIGMAIPIRSLFLVNGSRRVIWRGILYSFLMMLAKALVGLWMLVWPDAPSGYGWCGCRRKVSRQEEPQHSDVQLPQSHKPDDESKVVTLPRVQSAILVGSAMIARGEIALIVAQLARPLLVDSDNSSGVQGTSELFAIVIWAVLLTTVGGALGVGLLLRRWPA